MSTAAILKPCFTDFYNHKTGRDVSKLRNSELECYGYRGNGSIARLNFKVFIYLFISVGARVGYRVSPWPTHALQVNYSPSPQLSSF